MIFGGVFFCAKVESAEKLRKIQQNKKLTFLFFSKFAWNLSTFIRDLLKYKNMDELEKLEHLSLVSKICTELENHLELNDKDLGELIFLQSFSRCLTFSYFCVYSWIHHSSSGGKPKTRRLQERIAEKWSRIQRFLHLKLASNHSPDETHNRQQE